MPFIAMYQDSQDPRSFVVFESDWPRFIAQITKSLGREMRKAKSVEENLKNACFIDGSKIVVLS